MTAMERGGRKMGTSDRFRWLVSLLIGALFLVGTERAAQAAAGGLPQCEANLATCATNLAQVETALAAALAQVAALTAERDSLQAQLNTANTQLAQTQAALATAQAQVAALTAERDSLQAQLIVANAQLAQTQTDLNMCIADLAACQAATALASVPQTGQTSCWDASGVMIPCAGTGQDGEFQNGVAPPNPRFTDHGNGTVTDNLTSLIWLKDANCFGSRTWSQALADANNLASGQCGLTDGSSSGDWRLANVREHFSLLDFGNVWPALPTGHPFLNVGNDHYWTSTTDVDRGGVFAFTVHFAVPMVFPEVWKTGILAPTKVWPVR